MNALQRQVQWTPTTYRNALLRVARDSQRSWPVLDENPLVRLSAGFAFGGEQRDRWEYAYARLRDDVEREPAPHWERVLLSVWEASLRDEAFFRHWLNTIPT